MKKRQINIVKDHGRFCEDISFIGMFVMVIEIGTIRMNTYIAFIDE